jgi:uncharacterized phiE125 gp8 family phage protein
MTLRLVTAATDTVVSLDEAKLHLRVEGTDEDALITALIVAATADAEAYLGSALFDQTFDFVPETVPQSHFFSHSFGHHRAKVRLPITPLLSVEGVFYTLDGAETEIDAGSYFVETITGVITATTWPRADSLRVRFRAGYVDTQSSPAVGEVPPTIRAAVLLTIGHLYTNRESVMTDARVQALELPLGVTRLLGFKRTDMSMN